MTTELEYFKKWILSKDIDLATYPFVTMDMSGEVTAREHRPSPSTMIWVYGETSINVGRYIAGPGVNWTKMIIEF